MDIMVSIGKRAKNSIPNDQNATIVFVNAKRITPMVRVSHVNELGVLEKSQNFEIFRVCSVA